MKDKALLFLVILAFLAFLAISYVLYNLVQMSFQDLHSEIKRLEQELNYLKNKVDKIYQGRLSVIATGYTSNVICCGKDDGVTASGKIASWGTIAMDKKYKFGTKVFIPMFQKTFTVLDRGGAIKGNRIDIWFPTYEEALQFGVKRIQVYILP